MAEIREADSGDIKKIMPLQYELFKKEKSKEKFYSIKEFWFFTIEHKSHLIYLAENPNNHIFIAAANENLIGYLAIQIRQRQPFMEKLAEISEIYIEPAFRHLEIADKLFDKSLEWAKEKGIKWIAMPIYCKDESAINFWKKRGFSETERIYVNNISNI